MSLEGKTLFVVNKMHRITSFTSIQGVIGVGKSTFMKRLKKWIVESGQCASTCTNLGHSNYYLIVDEPVDEWSIPAYRLGNINDTESTLVSMLGAFYSDMKRWGFPFQVNAFTTRLRRIITAIDSINAAIPEGARIHIIAERSLRTDLLFFRNLYESGMVTQIEFHIYKSFYDTICEDTLNKETGMIYIKADATRCLSRLKKRDRSDETSYCKTEEEELVFHNYLVSLEKAHESVIGDFRQSHGESSVFTVNAEEDRADYNENYDSIVAVFMRERTVHVAC